MNKLAKAIFFDRDGVLIRAPVNNKREPKSIKTKNQIKFIRGIKTFCKTFKGKFLLIMITNQPEFTRKKNTKKNINEINIFIKNKLKLDDIFISYSDNEKNFFRKPNPGMLLNAKEKYKIQFKKSFFIGDRWRDVDAGNKVGCKTIFINRSYSERLNTKPKFTVNTIREIYNFIK